MRVYNGTNSQLDLPLSGNQRISISAHSVSGDIMPSTEFLSLLVGSYDYSEIALIVSGPFEINMCSSVSGSVGFVVQSLEEAIERFAIDKNCCEEKNYKENNLSSDKKEDLLVENSTENISDKEENKKEENTEEEVDKKNKRKKA